MIKQQQLKSAIELASNNGVHFPNESKEYRLARNALLAEEIELRRHIERVAAQRRALPVGGEVHKAYRFEGEDGHLDFAGLFGEKQTLAIYSYMFGPERQRPCPMCTSLLSAWDGEAADVAQRISLVVIARSPIERLIAFKKERGWQHLKLYSDISVTTAATMSAPKMLMHPLSMCLAAAMAQSAISGVAKWVQQAPTPARTHAVHLTSCHSGPYSTAPLRDAARTGIQNSTTQNQQAKEMKNEIPDHGQSDQRF